MAFGKNTDTKTITSVLGWLRSSIQGDSMEEKEDVLKAKPLHLEVSVDDRRLALVQAGHCLAGVTEDVEDLSFAEAHI